MLSPEGEAVRNQLMEQMKNDTSDSWTTVEGIRQALEDMFSGLTIDPEVKIEKVTIGQIPGEWLIAPNSLNDRVFLYLHGGGYLVGSCNTHRDLAARISRSTASRVLVIEYRLAPEHPFPAAIEDAVSVYRFLLSSGVSPEKIIIGGDSAGGGLSVATLLSLRDANVPLPALAILISPFTDMECCGETMKTRANVDPMLSPEAIRFYPPYYINNLDPRHPLVSPIHADLQGLPPMLVHVGDHECLKDDSVRLVEKARVAGVDVTFKIWEELWHVFHWQAPYMPEARQGIEEIGEYVRKRLG